MIFLLINYANRVHLYKLPKIVYGISLIIYP